MMRKLFICLANSKKYNQRCIAGVEVYLGKNQKFHVVLQGERPVWIRPVTKEGRGEVPTSLVEKMKLLDVYEVNVIRPNPKGHQTENVLFDKYSLKKVKTLENVTAEKMNWLLVKEQKCIFYGQHKTIPKDSIHSVNHSLCIVRAENVRFYNKKYREWEVELRLRVQFTYLDAQYDMPVTDVDFLANYQQHPIEEVTDKTIFLTISISNEFEGLFYKLAAGVIII
ncbi:MAG: hypothetical protein AAF960_20820 [Bacteroidota bacterium]